MRFEPARAFRLALAASLTVSAALFFACSWRWPLVGDASLIHYIAFLIERGWAPYRDLGDMNMPGSYLIELAAMHVFGRGALAWRLFDFTLLAAASASFFAITHRGAPAGVPGERSLLAGVARLDSETSESSSKRPGSPLSSLVGSTTQSPGAPSMTVASSWVGSRDGWLAGLLAATLLILIHGRDGLAEGGQRDLTMAVCLIAATAFLLAAIRAQHRTAAVLSAAAFGLLSGIAFTIKPTTLPLTLLQLALAAHVLRAQTTKSEAVILSAARSGQSKAPRISSARLTQPASLAWLIASALAFAFLLREHALAAFLAGFHGIIPYYASLGHRSFGFVLLHSISPLLPLVIAWIAVLALARPTLDLTRTLLAAGVLFGLVNCLVQQRALPYYRYPLLAFLLPLIAIDLTRAFDSAIEPGAPSFPVSSERVGSRQFAPALAALALAFAGFFLAPQSAVLIHRYRWWETDFINSLEQNLNALGGPALSHRIQCIDSISGCGNVLYRMSLEPATGVLSDFLLFGPDSAPIVRETRAQFSAAMLADPPQVIVVTSHLHIDGPDNFEKLARWPAFAEFLATHYILATEWSPTRTARWWSREETPASFRIYVLRDHAPQHE